VTEPCPECEVLAGRREAPGGILADDGEFAVHCVLGGSPLEGWCVIVPKIHAVSLDALSTEQLARVMPFAAKITKAQRERLGAGKSYVALFAERVPHVHFHVIPRFESTPDRLRGAAAFLWQPADAVPEEQILRAAHALREALR